MRIRAEVHAVGEPYSDMLPELDVSGGVPAAGDELVIDEVEYTCVRRRFVYDEAGRPLQIALFVRRSVPGDA
jgi:hypothetical protein